MRDSVVELARYVESGLKKENEPWVSGSATRPPKDGQKPTGRRGILVLVASHVGPARIMQEWSSLMSLFKPEIAKRLAYWMRDPSGVSFIGSISKEEFAVIEEVAAHSKALLSSSPERPGEVFYDILRLLMIHWLRKLGPVSSKKLGEQAGCSYPTVAEALRRLEPGYLRRHSNRSVELAAFPVAAWQQLLAQMPKVRAPRKYVDKSGRPRPMHVLLGRLWEMNRQDVAVGGVAGARHYMPGLDMAGLPRLDLVEMAGADEDTDALVRRLDPALQPAEPGDIPQVVVHRLYRPASHFGKRMGEPERWADEVECLLDLHEMALEPQAEEFLNYLKKRPKIDYFGDYEG